MAYSREQAKTSCDRLKNAKNTQEARFAQHLETFFCPTDILCIFFGVDARSQSP
jgi:hypothetical protein